MALRHDFVSFIKSRIRTKHEVSLDGVLRKPFLTLADVIWCLIKSDIKNRHNLDIWKKRSKVRFVQNSLQTKTKWKLFLSWAFSILFQIECMNYIINSFFRLGTDPLHFIWQRGIYFWDKLWSDCLTSFLIRVIIYNYWNRSN